MSTAALASARRRRTTNDVSLPPQPQSANNKTAQQESPNSSKQVVPPQSLTPLQILQIHDNKLKDLEALMIELNSEEYITNVVEEKINDLMQEKLVDFSNKLEKATPSISNNMTNNTSSDLETKLQMLETIQNVRFDEFKNGMQQNFNTFKENTIKMIELLNTKEATISSTNVSMPTSNESSVEKLELLTKEVSELKLLVIKNQTLALESSNAIINVKDEFKLNNQKMVQIIDKITMLSNRQCNEPQCDPAQMFLQSFMKNKFFGGASNVDQCYDDDESGDNMNYTDINKKLHIDLNNEEVLLNDEDVILNGEELTLNSDELIIDENQLQEILEITAMEEIILNNESLKQEVIAEINAEDSNLEDTNVEDTSVQDTNVEDTNVEDTSVQDSK